MGIAKYFLKSLFRTRQKRIAMLFRIIWGVIAFLSFTGFAQDTIPYTVERGVRYDDHEKGVMDIYVPERKGTALRRAIVLIHGGSWTGRAGNQVGDSRSFAQRGLVVFNISYRTTHRALEPVRDARTVVRWIRQHAEKYAIHPDAIGAMGWSAGAWSASYLGFSMDGDSVLSKEKAYQKESRPRKVFALDPPDRKYPQHSSRVQATILSSGVKWHEVKSRVWAYRPGQKPNPVERLPAVYAMGGDVHMSRWNSFKQEYQEMGVKAEIKEYLLPQMQHGPGLGPKCQYAKGAKECWDVRDEVTAFLKRNMPIDGEPEPVTVGVWSNTSGQAFPPSQRSTVNWFGQWGVVLQSEKRFEANFKVNGAKRLGIP